MKNVSGCCWYLIALWHGWFLGCYLTQLWVAAGFGYNVFVSLCKLCSQTRYTRVLGAFRTSY